MLERSSNLAAACSVHLADRERHLQAQAKYEEALRIAPEGAKKQRAVYHANLAACHLRYKPFAPAWPVKIAMICMQISLSYGP